jgi:hypothetical protein
MQKRGRKGMPVLDREIEVSENGFLTFDFLLMFIRYLRFQK